MRETFTPGRRRRRASRVRLVFTLGVGLSLWLATSHAAAPKGQGQNPPNAPATAAAVALTNVLFNVSDANDQPVTSLRQEDVRVSEDGVAQAVKSFTPQADMALSAVIALDNSMSQERLLPATRKVAQALVPYLLRTPKDHAAVVAFAKETVLEQDFTGNPDRVAKAIEGVSVLPLGTIGIIEGGSTSLRDALWVIGNDLLPQTPPETRRVLILITDGADTSSEKKMREATDSILKAACVIYVLGVGDKYYSDVNKKVLRELAERTGGRAYFPREGDKLHPMFAQMRSDLSAQYRVTYETPAGKGGKDVLRKLKIEIVNPELRKRNLRVTYPQGYFPST
ncbi:MAG: hypothetical protein QOD28_2327 [Acidobacteriota bacterium]|nr:hypothetical protein [Acidobacteriota bacterium]